MRSPGRTDLNPREESRVRARDRKRRKPKMVVDDAARKLALIKRERVRAV